MVDLGVDLCMFICWRHFEDLMSVQTMLLASSADSVNGVQKMQEDM